MLLLTSPLLSLHRGCASLSRKPPAETYIVYAPWQGATQGRNRPRDAARPQRRAASRGRGGKEVQSGTRTRSSAGFAKARLARPRLRVRKGGKYKQKKAKTTNVERQRVPQVNNNNNNTPAGGARLAGAGEQGACGPPRAARAAAPRATTRGRPVGCRSNPIILRVHADASPLCVCCGVR